MLAEFDAEFLLIFSTSCLLESASECRDERLLASHVRRLAFNLGCFMAAKQMILNLEPPKAVSEHLKRKIEKALMYFIEGRHGGIFKQIFDYQLDSSHVVFKTASSEKASSMPGG